jgi:ferredoxin-NADP reductase
MISRWALHMLIYLYFMIQIRVLKQDLKVGDEVALKPGKNRLEYRGQYLPVTDMVYIACGTGVVPVMDQVRMVLPSTSSSSVESVTVVWINESTRDFDVTAEQLEKEYHKYNTKLAVSCIVDDLTKGDSAMNNNPEIYEAVPDFIPGTMAVLSGPVAIMRKAAAYLQSRGYPLDCMCVL